MADNVEQRRLQALLRFAIEAGSHESDPSAEDSAVPVTANAAGDRAWLNEAMQSHASRQFDPVNYMKQQLATVYRYLNPAKKEDEEIQIEQVYDTLEEISDNCDQLDLASDLHKIGGFDVMIQCMKHKDSGICWRACDVLATATQNHEYCQNALLEMKALPILLSLIDNIAAEDQVREKGFYALSCTVRGNEKVLKSLEENDGFSTLIRAMQSDNARLKMKSVFFVKSLCEGDAKYASILHERGIEQQIVGMLKNYDSSDSLDIVENLLGCLYCLVSSSGKSKKECSDSSFGLSQLLRDLKSTFSSSGEEYDECGRLCDKILDSCFRDDDDADDR